MDNVEHRQRSCDAVGRRGGSRNADDVSEEAGDAGGEGGDLGSEVHKMWRSEKESNIFDCVTGLKVGVSVHYTGKSSKKRE